jgi:3-deoxy-D-manno-octulosonic-acid transferase
MTFLYRMVTFLIYLVLYPYGRLRAAAGREMWHGRLALIPRHGPKDVWIHAASVGEVKVIGILIDHMLRLEPSLAIHVTVMTAAGFKTAVSQFGQNLTVSFFPLDVTSLVRRTLDMIQPKMIVVAETEIWPNLIIEAGRQGLPIVLINGRMTEKSFGKYKFFRASLAKLFEGYDRFFFKTDQDFERYQYFGVSRERSVVLGDMKFDAPLVEKSAPKVSDIRRRAGVADGEFFLVAGSTRHGEDEILIGLYRSLKPEFSDLRLLLAPRHLERVKEVCQLIVREGFECAIYNGAGLEGVSGAGAVVVVDRMGLLSDLYLAADLAFVGGTLVDIGGHNLLEPVCARTPVVFGKSLDNVAEAADYIVDHKFGAKASSTQELRELIADVIAGRRRFATRNESDKRSTPVAQVSSYVLDRLDHV